MVTIEIWSQNAPIEANDRARSRRSRNVCQDTPRWSAFRRGSVIPICTMRSEFGIGQGRCRMAQ
jgi:hypothetical protein